MIQELKFNNPESINSTEKILGEMHLESMIDSLITSREYYLEEGENEQIIEILKANKIVITDQTFITNDLTKLLKGVCEEAPHMRGTSYNRSDRKRVTFLIENLDDLLKDIKDYPQKKETLITIFIRDSNYRSVIIQTLFKHLQDLQEKGKLNNEKKRAIKRILSDNYNVIESVSFDTDFLDYILEPSDYTILEPLLKKIGTFPSDGYLKIKKMFMSVNYFIPFSNNQKNAIYRILIDNYEVIESGYFSKENLVDIFIMIDNVDKNFEFLNDNLDKLLKNIKDYPEEKDKLIATFNQNFREGTPFLQYRKKILGLFGGDKKRQTKKRQTKRRQTKRRQ